MSTDERLADFINQEPMVFMDCTTTEILSSFTYGCGAAVCSGIFLGLVLSSLAVGLILALILTVCFVYALLNYFRFVRQKHYLTWLKEKIFLFQRFLRMSFMGARIPFITDSVRYGKGIRGERNE